MNAAVLEEPIEGAITTPDRGRQRLTKRYAKVSPGSAAESELVEENLKLVKHIVGRLALSLPSHIDLQDIYSSGLVGLLNAVRNFDPEGGSSFESYARVRIRGAIFDELRRMDWVPRSVHDKARKVQGVSSRLEQELGRNPTDAEIAEEMNLTAEEYDQLMTDIQPATFVCLDAVSDTGEDKEITRHETIADQFTPSPDATADRKELARIVAGRLERLPEMQRKVLALYYFEDMRLREIAEAMGLTESRICQIHGQAILSIKAYLRQHAELRSF